VQDYIKQRTNIVSSDVMDMTISSVRSKFKQTLHLEDYKTLNATIFYRKLNRHYISWIIAQT